MKDRRSPFYAYRYLVTPISNQISILHQTNKEKEELFKDIIQGFHTDKKTEWSSKSKRFLIYGFQKKNNFYVLKYAKESIENIFKEGEDDITVEGVKETKFVYLIIDIEHQIILLERNTSVFSSPRTSIKYLGDYLRDRMHHFDYAVNVYPLVRERNFWKYVNEADEIYELDLLVNAPNMPLLGNKGTKSILEDIKKATNNEEFEIRFKNKEGKLKIAREALGSWIEYIQEVGGKYVIRFLKNGIKEVKNSYDDIAKTYIARKKTKPYTTEELEDIEMKLRLMNKLEDREKNDE